MARVRIGVVAWNCAPELDACLSALPAALGDLDHDVLVVDNHSDDDSAAVARGHRAEVRELASNVGYARAMNIALAAPEAEFVVALNPDTTPPPDSIRRLVDVLAANPRAGLVAPLLVQPDGQLQHSVHRLPSLRLALLANLVPLRLVPARMRDRFWLHGSVRPDRAGRIDWAVGAVHVIRNAAVGAGPVYSERWFMYVEDLDLCWRLARDGWEVRLDTAVPIPHVGGASAVQAFGDRQHLRWWHDTYDWYELAHGLLARRLYALANATGEALRTLFGTSAGGRREARRNARLHLSSVTASRLEPLPPPEPGH